MENEKILEIKKHFADRSNIYDELGTWVNNDTILSSILSCLPTSPNQTLNIIDLGAGTGAVSKYILKNYQFDKCITAVDICEEMLSQITDKGINKCIADIEILPFSNDSFDVVISRQCLHYIEQLKNVTYEIKRILRGNGIFVLSQIIPIKNVEEDYWRKLIKFRQPLRKQFLNEEDWIRTFSSEGFMPISVERFSHRSSIKKWVNKYKINNQPLIDEYKKLLITAPSSFIDAYNVSLNDDDVCYNSFWIVVKFSI